LDQHQYDLECPYPQTQANMLGFLKACRKLHTETLMYRYALVINSN